MGTRQGNKRNIRKNEQVGALLESTAQILYSPNISKNGHSLAFKDLLIFESKNDTVTKSNDSNKQTQVKGHNQGSDV